MDFGKLPNIDHVDFTLPPDDEETSRFLKSVPKDEDKPNVYIACPVWTDKGFVGKIIPKGTKQTDFLNQYSLQFNSIELNSTYYRTDRDLIARWKQKVPEHFLFCPKVTRQISHIHQLINCEGFTQNFCESIMAFEENLGPSFLLLPQHFAPNRLDVLADFLQTFPSNIPLGVELRNPEWFSDPIAKKEVFDLFKRTKTISIITDVAGRRDVLHQRITHPEVIIRFVGNRLHPTDFARLDEWVLKLKEWFDQGLKTVYLFMHQPEEHLVVDLCEYFIPKLNEALGTDIPVPGIRKEPEQTSLF
jgi:uncharacterized protein YecE (DUF72 family)